MIQLRKFHFISLFLLICGFAAPAVAGSYDTGQVFTMTNGTIAAFHLVGNRELVPIPGVTGLPTTVNGLAAN